MGSLSGIFGVLFAGVWLTLVGSMIIIELKKARRTKWLIFVSGLLIFIGFAGFFAEMSSAEGMLELPKSYEWPAGYTSGIVTTPSGLYIVPLVPEGRIQLYDSNWHFLRGWNVDAMGGDFKVFTEPDAKIEVLTARGAHRYTFTENGDFLSVASLSDSYSSLPKGGQSLFVPTSPLLWIFSGPAISWSVGVFGFIGLGAVKKFNGRPPYVRKIRESVKT
jgi:hypothetical protein